MARLHDRGDRKHGAAGGWIRSLYSEIMAATRRRKLVQAGTVAPEFHLPKLDGGEISLEEIAGDRPVLFAFYKVTCPVCQLTFPYLERLSASDKLSVYGICQN